MLQQIELLPQSPKPSPCANQSLVMLVGRPVQMNFIGSFANHASVMVFSPSGAALLQSYPDGNKSYGKYGQNWAGVSTGRDAFYTPGPPANGFNTFTNVVSSTWVNGDLVGSGMVNAARDVWNGMGVSYDPLSTNSNYFAYTAYNALTGQSAPSHPVTFPGSNYAPCK